MRLVRGMRGDIVRGAILVLALILYGLPSSLQAQQTGTVTGTVADATTGQPLADAQVVISGTRLGTLTNARGGYRIDGVAAGTIEIQVQGLGYASARRTLVVAPGEVVTSDFGLAVSAVVLDEMVVTVTGLQRRRELGNAASIISATEEMGKAAPTTLASLLQGRAAGVQVLQSSGTVGGSASIKIRGSNSINLDDTPLIYIDGSRVSNDVRSGPGVGGQNTSRLNDINLDDIESIEIVKGPSAATLYGTEAAAGVIRITTKKGRAGTTQWTLRSELSANWNATDWPSTAWNPRSFYGESIDVSELLPLGTLPEGQYFAQITDTLYSLNLLGDGTAGDSVYGTPWRTGIEQAQGLSVRRGAGNVTYFVSGEFEQRQGNLSNNEVTQRNVRANVNLTPSDELSIGVSTGFSSNNASLPDNDNSTFGYLGVGLLGFPWAMPLRRADQVSGGESLTCPSAIEIQRALLKACLSYGLGEFAGACADNPFLGGRTFDDVATLVNEQKVERFNGSVTADYSPFDYLTLRGTLGYDEFSDQISQFVPVDADFPFNDLSRGFKSTSNLVTRNLTVDASVNATFELFPGQYNELYAVTWGDTQGIEWTVGNGGAPTRGNERWEFLDQFVRLNLLRVGPDGFRANDSNIPVALQLLYNRQESSVLMASGIEAALIQAEAAVRAGQTATAAQLLNALRSDYSLRLLLRSRVDLPSAGNQLAPLTLTGNLLFDLKIVADERARELWLTGDRMTTSRRFRLELGIDLFPSVKTAIGGGGDIAFPIPQLELDTNPNLGTDEACPADQVLGGWR